MQINTHVQSRYLTLTRVFLAMLVLISALISCVQKQNAEVGDFLPVNVTNSSGDDFSYMKDEVEHFYAPYPFNIGIYESEQNTVEVMILSKKLKRGQTVQVIPVARLSLHERSESYQDVIVATPVDENLKLFKGESFQDFTVNQFSIKQLIELWYSNRYNLQGTTMEGWSPVSLDYFKS